MAGPEGGRAKVDPGRRPGREAGAVSGSFGSETIAAGPFVPEGFTAVSAAHRTGRGDLGNRTRDLPIPDVVRAVEAAIRARSWCFPLDVNNATL